MLRASVLVAIARPLVGIVCLVLVLTSVHSSSFAAATGQTAQATSGDALWTDSAPIVLAAQSKRVIIPQKYRTVTLNVSALQKLLKAAPLERSTSAQRTQMTLSLPLPDGTFGRFRIVESPIMAPELAAKFPQLKTYAGQGIDDPTATVRFDWTPVGFHAMILSASDTVFIDPYQRNDTSTYISYFKRDFQPPAGKTFREAEPSSGDKRSRQEIATLVAPNLPKASGTQLRTYRLAVAADGEYTQFQGGTVTAALAAIVTTVNRVDGIYESEVAVRLVLIANNNLLIYTDPTTDPYIDDEPDVLLRENQANLDSVIGSGNYDIGHVFTIGGTGLATAGVCSASFKAQGETGSSSPVGDAYDVDYVAHEIGHQFGASHTFNSVQASCGGFNRRANSAYEPGSGSTIMAYAGICPPDNLQPHSDPYFATISFDQIVNYTTKTTCASTTNTGNTPPVPNAGASYTIPKQTPFTLIGSATDADNDALTYSWEEFDLGDPGPPNNDTNPPFFRAFPPTTSPSRTFPQWTDILNNIQTPGEILPNVTRTMNFRLTARDNKAGGGGVDYASTSIDVTTDAGPFLVTAPNTAVTWSGGSVQNVTWDVANTNAAPVSCANVNILLSTNGGFDYLTTLATNVPNNGSASVTVPNLTALVARVQVICANNIFFDVSNVNFSIKPAHVINSSVTQAGVTAASYNSTPVACGASSLANQTITPFLHNKTSTSFSGLYFKVKTLEYKATQAGNVQPRLCNGLPQGGGVGTTLSVAGNLLGSSDMTPSFVIGLPVRAAYRFFVDLYSTSTSAATTSNIAADDYLGTFEYEFDANGELIGQYPLFLPFVQR